MTKISKDTTENIAKLSRIGINEEEINSLTEDISSVISFVETLEKIDTTDIEPTSQVTGLKDVWREDKVHVCEISRDDLISNAPQTKDGYVLVKKVLK